MSLLTKEEEETIMRNTISTITTVEDACNRLINHMIKRYAEDENSNFLTDLEKLALKFYGQEVFTKFEDLKQINAVIQFVDENININNQIPDEDKQVTKYI